MRFGGYHFYVACKCECRSEQKPISSHDGTATSGPKTVVHLDVVEKNPIDFSVSRLVIVESSAFKRIFPINV